MTTVSHRLSTGVFTEDWSDTSLISTNDDWSNVPSIVGYRGDGLASGTGANPQTVTGTSTVVDVNANQTNPNTFTTGGVTEFQLTDPTIALAGSGTAKAPYLVFYMDSTGQQDVTVSYVLRDLETGGDNAQQQVSLQYRTSDGGTWIDVPAAYVSDATTGPNAAGPNISVSATLPAGADNQANLQIRVITTDAPSNDEWVGVDNIVIASSPLDTATQTLSIAATDASKLEGNSGTTPFTFTVTRSGDTSGSAEVNYAVTGSGTNPANASDFTNGVLPSGAVSFAAGETSRVITIGVNGDTAVEPNESFTVTLTDPTNGAVLGTASDSGIINNDDVVLTSIFTIQGSGNTSPLAGQKVTT